ncbi:unnamed protein product [Euphydryas editha]|uniref:Uncharacterized protein n=1 Tax=Euphydryas editha TaxID=104508 RepID=A0AAU9TIX6_EUPED|nr:unnamed protein product [Euphydryas editha]
MILINSPLSDHKQIYLEINKIKPPPRACCQYEAIDYRKYYDHVEQELPKLTNGDYAQLENVIKMCLDISKVRKTKILNPPQKDWINQKIILEINERNLLWVRHKDNPHEESLKEEFTKKRQHVAKLIQETRDQYHYKEFTKCSTKPKKMWTLIKTLAANKFACNSFPDKLDIDSLAVTDPFNICQTFNKYFANIGPQLAECIPNYYHNNFHRALPQVTPSKNCISSFEPCTEKEILNIILKLESSCSVGLDGLSTKAIKSIRNLICNKLTECFNGLICDGIFPNTLKIAKVTPIYKSGSNTDPGNYRPISHYCPPSIVKNFRKSFTHKITKLSTHD